MKVNQKNSRDISFSSVWNNKALKRGLEFAAENGTLFAATTSLVLSGVRPLAILATPNTDKKNKQVACAKSITSSFNGYLIALFCSKPISKAVKKIDKNPERYLSSETLVNLRDGKNDILKSKPYIFATQLFKLGLGFVIAAPKACLTALGTPYLLKTFTKESIDEEMKLSVNENINFKRKDKLPSAIGKIIDNKKLQDFVKKYKDTNFPLHIIAATDTLSTAVFIGQTKKSKDLKEKEKRPLIYNSIISTSLSIASTYLIDMLTRKKTDGLIEKYKKANAKDPNLAKQIEGLKIAKPILIAGLIYYILIPIISTFFAERIKYKNES